MKAQKESNKRLCNSITALWWTAIKLLYAWSLIHWEHYLILMQLWLRIPVKHQPYKIWHQSTGALCVCVCVWYVAHSSAVAVSAMFQSSSSHLICFSLHCDSLSCLCLLEESQSYFRISTQAEKGTLFSRKPQFLSHIHHYHRNW